MKKFLKAYFKVAMVMAIPMTFMVLIATMLCDLLWYGGFIGYSNTIYQFIAIICGMVIGLMIGIAGFNIVIEKKWTFKIGAK